MEAWKTYQTRPKYVRALQWHGGNHRDMYDFLTGTKNMPILVRGDVFEIDHSLGNGGLLIKTLGTSDYKLVPIGYWATKTLAGNYSAMSDRDFANNFEEY